MPLTATTSAHPALTTIDLLQAELGRRRLLKLGFPPALEQRFEADTRRARCWNIRLTVLLGLACYLSFTLADDRLLPDLGWLPLASRLGLVIPCGLFTLWMCGWASNRLRERSVSVSIASIQTIPITFMILSHAPLANYTMLSVILLSLFANVTMRIRFHHACITSGYTLLLVAAFVILRPDTDPAIVVVIIISTLTCISFGIVANNQLERSERQGFLLNLLAETRADAIRVDKDRFSVLSQLDALTGLANRRSFDLRLAELNQRGDAGGGGFALLLADVDHFKSFNDQYGHPAGDACLQRIGRILGEVGRRRNDLAARYGGEEFAILLTDCTHDEAARIGDALCEAVRAAAIAHDRTGDGPGFVTISIGIALSGDFAHSIRPDALLVAADQRLYRAKREGRDRACSTQLEAGLPA